MTFNYIANRKIDAITQSFVFNLVNLNKTAADIGTLTSEADTVIAAITGLDNPLWETESVVKKIVSTSDSKKDISDWKAAVDVDIVCKNYNATGKAKYYYHAFKNIAMAALVTQINAYIANIGTGLTTNNFYIQSIVVTEHI